MIITPASAPDLPRLLQFRADAAAWLTERGLDQWALPFPAEHIARSIERGEVFMVKPDAAAETAATITVDTDADPLLWTEGERAEPALYVHKLTVDRGFSGVGLGRNLLDWAGDRAFRYGAKWLRLDAWTTNERLQRYYLNEGFKHVRTVHDPAVGGSGWVGQRLAQADDDHGLA